MTAKLTASADGSKVLIGNAAEDALEIDSVAKTIKALSPYTLAGNGPAFSATASAQQSLAVNVATKINFDTENFDTANCYDTALARFTPNVAGYYQINMAAGNIAALDTFGIYTFIGKNGATISIGSGSTGNASTFARGACSDVIYLNGTTDYVEASMVGTGPSGSVNCQGFQFSGALVRAA